MREVRSIKRYNKEQFDIAAIPWSSLESFDEYKTVEEILRSLKINKAAGPDKIPARLLRDAAK